ncbi:MAG: prepilin-type N-terminal cleavage/methylation domain-containing protein [Firmicutes bacterium]|jgi:prepilin-type N-terminal cleavage/methylation domain-containing protein|nr:prepilin-type N-terminal cleavage/methylation domain-containing protein [Bacillota bacterium]
MPKPRTDGFTLLELLIVISLLSILSLFAVPQGNKLLATSQLRQAAGILVANMRQLELKAAVEERSYCIEFVYTLDHSRDGYIIRRLGYDGYLEPEAHFQPFPPGIRIRNNYLYPKDRTVWFHPSGSPSTGASIPLENRVGEVLTIRILPVTGRIRVVEE